MKKSEVKFSPVLGRPNFHSYSYDPITEMRRAGLGEIECDHFSIDLNAVAVKPIAEAKNNFYGNENNRITDILNAAGYSLEEHDKKCEMHKWHYVCSNVKTLSSYCYTRLYHNIYTTNFLREMATGLIESGLDLRYTTFENFLQVITDVPKDHTGAITRGLYLDYLRGCRLSQCTCGFIVKIWNSCVEDFKTSVGSIKPVIRISFSPEFEQDFINYDLASKKITEYIFNRIRQVLDRQNEKELCFWFPYANAGVSGFGYATNLDLVWDRDLSSSAFEYISNSIFSYFKKKIKDKLKSDKKKVEPNVNSWEELIATVQNHPASFVQQYTAEYMYDTLAFNTATFRTAF